MQPGINTRLQTRNEIMTDGFEWNEEKAQSNRRKHGISFEEAATVFDDPQCLITDDPAHSINEFRFIVLGYSIAQRLLVVAHTDRNQVIRIVSARLATSSERRMYERGL